jgi:hypothetical protein
MRQLLLSRVLLGCPTTKQGASDVANEHIQDCHTQKQEEHSANKAIDHNTWMVGPQYQPKRRVAVAVAL